MNKYTLLSILITGSLVGCAAPSYNYQPVPKHVSKPPVDSINTAYIGDKMLEQGLLVDREVLNIQEITKVFGYTLTPGFYLKTGHNKKGTYFKPSNHIANGGVVQRGIISDPFKDVMLGVDGKLCVITFANAKSCTDEHRAVISTIAIASDDSFQQTLIYSGKVGDKINVDYREFSSNVARPAFNNDVEYDLKESKQIGYKGALLEVIDANNQNITYRVLRNFKRSE